MKNLLFVFATFLSTNAFLFPYIPKYKLTSLSMTDEYLDFNESGIPIPVTSPQTGVRIIFKPGDTQMKEIFKRLNEEDDNSNFGSKMEGKKSKFRSF